MERRKFGHVPLISSTGLVFLPGVAVLCLVIFVSLSRWEVTTGNFVGFPTMFGFKDALTSGRGVILRQQLARAICVATLDLIIAAPAAYILARKLQVRTRMTVIGLFLVPFFINSATRAFAWKAILGHAGPIGGVLGLAGASDEICHMFLHKSFSVTLCLMGSSIPFALFPIVGILSAVRPNLWQICDDLGMDASSEFFSVALPLCSSGLIYGWAVSFVVVCLSAVEIDITGGASEHSLSTTVKGLFDKGEPNAAVALGLSLVIGMIVVLCSLAGLVWVMRRIKNRFIPNIPGIRYLQFGFLALAILLVVAPGVAVLVSTGYKLAQFHPLSRNFDIVFLSLSDHQIQSAAFNTLLLCLGVAIPTTIGAVISGLSWWDATDENATLGSAEFRGIFLAALCFAAIPGEAYAIGIFALLKIWHLNFGSYGAIILAQIVWAFPFCVLTAATGFAAIRLNILRAAEDLGATRVTTFFTLILRNCWPEMILTAIVGAVLSINEFGRVNFLGGKNDFLSLYVTGRLASGGDVSDYLLASAGILTGFTVVACFIFCWRRAEIGKVPANTVLEASVIPSSQLKIQAKSYGAGS